MESGSVLILAGSHLPLEVLQKMIKNCEYQEHEIYKRRVSLGYAGHSHLISGASFINFASNTTEKKQYILAHTMCYTEIGPQEDIAPPAITVTEDMQKYLDEELFTFITTRDGYIQWNMTTTRSNPAAVANTIDLQKEIRWKTDPKFEDLQLYDRVRTTPTQALEIYGGGFQLPPEISERELAAQMRLYKQIQQERADKLMDVEDDNKNNK